jgi:hypothetical protein
MNKLLTMRRGGFYADLEIWVEATTHMLYRRNEVDNETGIMAVL